MAKVLITLQPGAGHLNAMAPLGRALQTAGHEVRLATSASFAPAVRAVGLTPVAAGRDIAAGKGGPGPSGFLQRGAAAQLQFFAGEAAAAVAADLVELAKAWRPDVIVRDNTEWGGWAAAQVLGVPSLAYGVTARIPPAALGPLLGTSLAGLRAAVGLPPDPTLVAAAGELFLDTTPASLAAQPGTTGTNAQLGTTGSNVVPVRPVYYDRRGPGDGVAAEMAPAVHEPGRWGEAGHLPLVLATLGTVYHHDDALVRKLLAAVAGEPYRVLVAGVGALACSTPGAGGAPPNVRLVDYTPLSQVLPHCRAVVCHGGRGTVLTALGSGVPVCAIPLGADQPVNALMVQRAGAGVLCATGESAMGPLRLPVADPAALDPLALRAQIRRVVDDPQYTTRARAMRDEIAALPGPDAVVALLEGRGLLSAVVGAAARA